MYNIFYYKKNNFHEMSKAELFLKKVNHPYLNIIKYLYLL